MTLTNPVWPTSHSIYAYLPSRYDLTPYVVGNIEGKMGMNDNKIGDRVATTGTLTFKLDNRTRLFSPGHSQALAGWKKGVTVRFEVVFDGLPHYIEGKVSEIDIPTVISKANFVTVTVVDWMEHAATHPIVNPGVKANYTGDQVIGFVLDNMSQSVNRDLDVGVTTFPTALDTVTSKTKAMSEFGKVAFSEGGYVYLKQTPQGPTLVFENRHARHGWNPLSDVPIHSTLSGRLLKEDGGFLLQENGDKILLDQVESFEATGTMVGTDAPYGKDVVNYLTVQANPRRVDSSPQVLFQLDAPIAIGSGNTYTLRGTYANPNGGAPCRGQNMITPVATTDYLANTKSDGTGTNKTAQVSLVSTPYGTEGFTHQIKNTDAGTIWITRYSPRGYGIYDPNPITHVESDSVSISQNEEITDIFNQEYQNTLDDGTILARKEIVDNSQPRIVPKKVTFIANRSLSLMQGFLNLSIGSYIHVVDAEIEKDINAYIQGIEFTCSPSGFIRYAWYIKEHKTLRNGLTAIGLEFRGAIPVLTYTDAADFGVISELNDLPDRTISVWALANGQAFNNTSIVAWGSTYRFFIDSVTMNIKLSVAQTDGAASTAFYSTAGNAMPTGTLTHLALVHSISTWTPVGAQPLLYVNGSPVALTAVGINTPDGTRNSEAGQHIVLGNLYEYGGEYASGWLGILKDFRIYNMRATQADILRLYNGGVPSSTVMTEPSSGLLFQAPCVPTSQLSSYINQALDSTLPVRDNAFGFIGSISGAPTGRSF